MLPAHQRFHAHEFSAFDLHFRLVVHAQLASVDRPPQLGLHFQSAHCSEIHRRIENLESCSSARLCLIHGHVRVTNEIDRRVVGHAVCDADARGGEHLVRAELERRIEGFQKRVGYFHRAIAAWQVRKENRELVAADARRDVAFADSLDDSLSCGDQ